MIMVVYDENLFAVIFELDEMFQSDARYQLSILRLFKCNLGAYFYIFDASFN